MVKDGFSETEEAGGVPELLLDPPPNSNHVSGLKKVSVLSSQLHQYEIVDDGILMQIIYQKGKDPQNGLDLMPKTFRSKLVSRLRKVNVFVDFSGFIKDEKADDGTLLEIIHQKRRIRKR